jgi:hypothetical protein
VLTARTARETKTSQRRTRSFFIIVWAIRVIIDRRSGGIIGILDEVPDMAAATQSYATHRHNPRPTGLAGLFWLAAIVCFGLSWFGYRTEGLGLLMLAASVFVLIAISRIYTTALQDRIIKLEMGLRCQRLLAPAVLATAERLTKPQLIALRFASDEELPELVERAAREQMTPDAIKRAVRNWRADWERT